MDELQGGAVSRTYTYGLSLISEQQTLAAAPVTSFYGYDGHGSVRYLTSSTGAVTDTYDFDAFGNLISSTGTTPNNYLFAGEQFDLALGIYYNRARYYDQRQGRFWTMDTWDGNLENPFSLHRYLYASVNPVSRVDRSGKEDFSIASNLSALGGAATIAAVEFQQVLVEAFEDGGGAVGRLFNQMGEYAENVAREVLELDPQLISQEIEEDVSVAGTGIGRQIDFLIRGAKSAGEFGEQLLLEVKYALPRVSGEALSRLTAQLNNAIASGKGQAVLWSLQNPGIQQVKLVLSSMGPNADKVQIVSGVEGLYRYLELFLGH
jgi:RHS repeat-associated protein